jgi:hypothetical protein
VCKYCIISCCAEGVYAVSHYTVHIVSITTVGGAKATGAPAAKKSKIGWNPDRIKVSSDVCSLCCDSITPQTPYAERDLARATLSTLMTLHSEQNCL